ncbi:MAG: hypothetical protein EOP33_04035 [Rickettsiaceae bacterium]|nr:MAG: hypothetical protein EOP33_04035 [Rickettsiaceae bacterium]
MRIKLFIFISLIIEWIGLNEIKIMNNKFILLTIACTCIVLLSVQIINNDGKYKFAVISYLFWLIKEIISSSISVIKVIWSRTIKEETSGLQQISIVGLNDTKVVIYSNSITLTPGTIALEINDQILLVHALDKNSSLDLEAGIMKNKVCQLF